MSGIASVSVKRLAELNEQGKIDLIDVRTPVEFREVHASIAQNAPLDSLDPDDLMQHRNGQAGEPVYIICRSGNRSTKACEQFVAAGHTNVINVEGGTLAWDKAGLPLVRGKKAVSLERQVRIVAGFLVLVGSVLGLFHPYFLALPALVGAGLILSGITDSCVMGMMLAKMPWNQVKEEGATCSSR